MSNTNIAKTAFIGGISKKVQEEDLRDSFKSYGPITNIKMKGDFAFVEFDHEDDADRAIKEMGNNKICGHKITVQKSYGGRKERNKGPEGKDICYNCGNKGHW